MTIRQTENYIIHDRLWLQHLEYSELDMSDVSFKQENKHRQALNIKMYSCKEEIANLFMTYQFTMSDYRERKNKVHWYRHGGINKKSHSLWLKAFGIVIN